MQDQTKHPASPQPERAERSEAADGGGMTGGAVASAPSNPCNTLGANSITLRQGVDSLYLSFPGQLSDEGAIRLDQAREAARQTDDLGQSLCQISVLDHLFEAAPTGGKLFRYRLSDHAYSIQLKGKGSKHLPLAHVQIRSGHLMAVGVEQAVSQLRLILSYFGSVDGPATASRLDLCADLVAPIALNAWDYGAWVTRARHIDPHIVDGLFTGWSIGRGAVSARLYDKTAEIRESGKDYMRSVWRDCGWDGLSPVYRIEFQFRGAALKEFDAGDYPAVMTKLGGLWRYGAADWLRLTVPSETDKTKCRWPTHAFWEFVQGIEWPDVLPLTRVKIPVSLVPGDAQLFRPFFSSLTSFMAARRITDADEAWNRLYLDAREFYEEQAEFRQAGFYDQARLRAAKKATSYGVAYPGGADSAKAFQDEAVANEYAKRSGG